MVVKGCQIVYEKLKRFHEDERDLSVPLKVDIFCLRVFPSSICIQDANLFCEVLIGLKNHNILCTVDFIFKYHN